jgi:hypothetical protein
MLSPDTLHILDNMQADSSSHTELKEVIVLLKGIGSLLSRLGIMGSAHPVITMISCETLQLDKRIAGSSSRTELFEDLAAEDGTVDLGTVVLLLIDE